MTIGPLHILVVNLPDEQLTAPISQELRAARQRGAIRSDRYVIRHQGSGGQPAVQGDQRPEPGGEIRVRRHPAGFIWDAGGL